MQHISDILKNFNPTEAKYISREFQAYGCHLAEELQDTKRTSLYIKLAKTIHRSILEEALNFIKDSRPRNKAALFMWKLKKLRGDRKDKEGKMGKGEKRRNDKKDF